jgi:hypothetical protein
MIPVYFPFTHISAPLAGILCACFGGLIVYRPVEDHPDAPLDAAPEKLKHLPVDIRAPVREHDEQLIHLYRDFRQWGDFHDGGIRALKNRLDASVDAETFVTQIRSEILGKHSRRADPPDPLFSARLFLLTAHNYDMTLDAMEQTIAASDIDMAKMVSELKGTAGPDGSGTIHTAKTDPGAMMTGARLLSWYRLASRDPDADFGFLITTSPTVCDTLTQQIPSGRLVRSWDGLPCPSTDDHRAQWETYLTDAAGMKSDDRAFPPAPEIPAAFAGEFVFRLYLFPDLTPEQLMHGALPERERTHSIQPGIGNILVGVLESAKTSKRMLDSIL